jgi:hypothetical protein
MFRIVYVFISYCCSRQRRDDALSKAAASVRLNTCKELSADSLFRP